jgi:hypothetical protein
MCPIAAIVRGSGGRWRRAPAEPSLTHDGAASGPKPRGGLCLLAMALLPACVFELAPLETTGTGGTGGESCMVAKVEPDPKSRAQNPSFEDGESGWEGGDASLTVVETADALEGKAVMRVTYTGDGASSESYSINDATDTIASSVAGATYRARAWVRSAIQPPSPQARVSIILKSEEEGDIAESPEVEMGPCFMKIEASGVAEQGGAMIGVHVSQFERAPGDAFDIEMIEVFEELP